MVKLTSQMFPELTSGALAQLFAQNIVTISDFITESNDKLIKCTQLSHTDICDIKQCIIETFSGDVRKVPEILFKEDTVSTGIEKLDLLLNNGLHTGHMYEISGLPSCGKSQICHTIAANVSLNLSRSVHYIDTKRDFCASRVLEILESKKCTDEKIGEVLNNIKVTRIKNAQELITILHHLANSLQSNPTSIIIIDSLPVIFYKTSKDNTVAIALNQFVNVCKFLANKCQQIIITTNLISQWSEIEGFVPDKHVNSVTLKPSLGKYWLHIPDTRLLLEQLDNEERKISIWKSTYLKIGSFCTFKIVESGIS